MSDELQFIVENFFIYFDTSDKQSSMDTFSAIMSLETKTVREALLNSLEEDSGSKIEANDFGLRLAEEYKKSNKTIEQFFFSESNSDALNAFVDDMYKQYNYKSTIGGIAIDKVAGSWAYESRNVVLFLAIAELCAEDDSLLDELLDSGRMVDGFEARLRGPFPAELIQTY